MLAFFWRTCRTAAKVVGLRVLRAQLSDGERELAVLVDGLDEADRAVVEQMLELIAADSGPTLDGLSPAERGALAAEFASADERELARELEAQIAAKTALMSKKSAELEQLKHAAIKQRLQRDAARGGEIL